MLAAKFIHVKESESEIWERLVSENLGRSVSDILPPTPQPYPRPRFFTSTISIIMTWCPIKNFCIRHLVRPCKSA